MAGCSLVHHDQPLNHGPTVCYFEENAFFGLDTSEVMFFPQGVMPSLDIKTGQVLMTGPDEIATIPTGTAARSRPCTCRAPWPT